MLCRFRQLSLFGLGQRHIGIYKIIELGIFCLKKELFNWELGKKENSKKQKRKFFYEIGKYSIKS